MRTSLGFILQIHFTIYFYPEKKNLHFFLTGFFGCFSKAPTGFFFKIFNLNWVFFLTGFLGQKAPTAFLTGFITGFSEF